MLEDGLYMIPPPLVDHVHGPTDAGNTRVPRDRQAPPLVRCVFDADVPPLSKMESQQESPMFDQLEEATNSYNDKSAT